MDRIHQIKWNRERKTEAENMRSAKRMETAENGAYTYIGWDIPHLDGKSASCRRNMLEEERLFLE